MKKYFILFFCLQLTVATYAQVTYYDASKFPIIGKISKDTETRYERLPKYIKDNCRERLWQLGKNTSGLAIRFRSNSTQIAAKFNLVIDIRMNHMTATGMKGLDLYAWNGKDWQFVNSGRPIGVNNDVSIIKNMSKKEREFLLYLPLYDGITDLQIGIDSTAYIKTPKLLSPDTKNPIVFYGTSITQGGCASRPGMSYTSIIERMLKKETINLGFSGNGKLDYEIAEVMSKRHDASLFVLDFIPNVNDTQIVEKTAHFVDIIRKENPTTPILLVESITFPHSAFDTKIRKIVEDKNKALHEEYNKLKQNGYKNIYYLSGEDLIGSDGETTVDGIHLTDLGFVRFANKLQKSIDKILK